MSECDQAGVGTPIKPVAEDGTDAALTIDALLARWRYGVSRGTLANWRSKGSGPPWRKIGATILYPLAGIEAYERDRTAGGRWWKAVRLTALIEAPAASKPKPRKT